MSARDVHLRIGRLVVHDDGTFSAADLEAAIGQAIRQRLEGMEPPRAVRSLSERIADGVLGHPDVASAALQAGPEKSAERRDP